MVDDKGSDVRVGETRVWYRVRGTGEPVVQIHGMGLGHQNFDSVTDRFASEFTVIELDLPGCGLSDRSAGPYSVEGWADTVAAVMEAAGAESAHVHATSMGGMVGIVFGGKYPKKTRSLVISCSLARPGSASRMKLAIWKELAKTQGLDSPMLAQILALDAVSAAFISQAGEGLVAGIQEAMLERNDPASFDASLDAFAAADVSEWLSKITAPTLVIGGDLDSMTPWDQGPDGVGQAAIASATGAETYVIKGAGHSTLFEAADEHYERVREFFLSNSSSEQPDGRIGATA
jgi:3-oxoadipate enol-lactonase